MVIIKSWCFSVYCLGYGIGDASANVFGMHTCEIVGPKKEKIFHERVNLLIKKEYINNNHIFIEYR